MGSTSPDDTMSSVCRQVFLPWARCVPASEHNDHYISSSTSAFHFHQHLHTYTYAYTHAKQSIESFFFVKKFWRIGFTLLMALFALLEDAFEFGALGNMPGALTAEH